MRGSEHLGGTLPALRRAPHDGSVLPCAPTCTMTSYHTPTLASTSDSSEKGSRFTAQEKEMLAWVESTSFHPHYFPLPNPCPKKGALNTPKKEP